MAEKKRVISYNPEEFAEYLGTSVEEAREVLDKHTPLEEDQSLKEFLQHD